MRLSQLCSLTLFLFLAACQTLDDRVDAPSCEAAAETATEPTEGPAGHPAHESLADPGDRPLHAYAYSSEHPVLLGGENTDDGPAREHRYLKSLRGPDGQKVTFSRKGSCCYFKIPNSPLGGLLDMYEVTYDGQDEPALLYLNMYDSGEALAPEGFSLQEDK